MSTSAPKRSKRRPQPFVPLLEQRPALGRRREPRQRRSQELITVLLTATERLLLSEGLEGTTSQRIAELAGVSIGSLYQYFPTSLAVLRALLERHLEEIGGEIAEAMGVATDPADLVEKVLGAFLHAKQQRGALSLALRRIESLIEGQLVEQEALRHLTTMFLARLQTLQPTGGPPAWQVEMRLAAIAGAVGHVLASAPERLADPDLKDALVQMTLGVVMRT